MTNKEREEALAKWWGDKWAFNPLALKGAFRDGFDAGQQSALSIFRTPGQTFEEWIGKHAYLLSAADKSHWEDCFSAGQLSIQEIVERYCRTMVKAQLDLTHKRQRYEALRTAVEEFLKKWEPCTPSHSSQGLDLTKLRQAIEPKE